MQRKAFQRVKEGDPISAKQYNELLEAVEMLSGLVIKGGASFEGPFGTTYLPHDIDQLQLVQLNSDLVDAPHAATANELYFDDTVADGSDPWKDSGNDEDWVCAPYVGTWLSGERTVVMRDSQSNRNVMLPFSQIHLAKLDAELTAGSTATASIWEFQASGLGDSNKNELVYDWMLATGESLAAGTKIVIIQHRQSLNWVVIAAACSAG